MNFKTALFCLALAAALIATPGAASTVGAQEAPPEPPAQEKPNVLLVLTDDQEESTLAHMPGVQREFIEQGRTFENTVNVWPVCCPSRTTILRGQYPHNHGVTDNTGPNGGWPAFKGRGLDQDNVATWLDAEGYDTAYFGKLMNGYRSPQAPPGWDSWYAYSGSRAMGTTRISNGERRFKTRSRVQAEALVANRAKTWLEAREGDPDPFFAVVSFAGPHSPFSHPRSTEKMFRSVKAPRTAALNERNVSDKPAYIRKRALLGGKGYRRVDENYRDALRSLVVVDRFVSGSAPSLPEDTYSFFYTDNGSHNGQYRLPHGKRTPYETDVGFPLLARGPGIEPGSTASALVGNHDLAPTFAHLGGAPVPEYVDGRSIRPVLEGEKPSGWRQRILSESFRSERNVAPVWHAVRTEDETYVEYEDGFRELYDLDTDPHQTDNLLSPSGVSAAEVAPATPRETTQHSLYIQALKGCEAQVCREAEGGDL